MFCLLWQKLKVLIEFCLENLLGLFFVVCFFIEETCFSLRIFYVYVKGHDCRKFVIEIFLKQVRQYMYFSVEQISRVFDVNLGILFVISPYKHMSWILIRIASVRRF